MEFIKVKISYFYYCKELSYQELLMYCYLEHKSNYVSDGLLRLSNGDLANVFSIDRQRVNKLLKKLSKAGFIKIYNSSITGRVIKVISLEEKYSSNYDETSKETNRILNELKSKWSKQ